MPAKQSGDQTSFRFVPTIWKVIILLIIGLVLSVVITLTLNHTYLETLKERINTVALAVNPEDIAKLEDLTKPNNEVPYDTVKTRLTRIKKTQSDTRFVYLMDRTADGKIVFLADSEPKNSSGYSPRGSVYPDATDALKAAFDNKRTFVEGPVRDDYGIWYSALAPIYDKNGKFVALIGTDVPLTSYGWLILGTGSVPFLIALIGAVATYIFDRSRRRRLEALRFQIELMSITSHELQAPIRGLRWGEETLLKTQLDESQAKLVQTMHDGTIQLENSVDNILQLNSLESPNSPDTTTNVDLVAVFQDVTTTNLLSATQRSIRLTFEPSWPATMMTRGDTISLRRCINSVISGEVKNTKDGGSLHFSYELQKDNHVISIANSSLNVARDELNDIFDYSHQTTKLVKSTSIGEGMGLFMARTILEKFGGTITVQSPETSAEVLVKITLPTITNDL